MSKVASNKVYGKGPCGCQIKLAEAWRIILKKARTKNKQRNQLKQRNLKWTEAEKPKDKWIKIEMPPSKQVFLGYKFEAFFFLVNVVSLASFRNENF